KTAPATVAALPPHRRATAPRKTAAAAPPAVLAWCCLHSWPSAPSFKIQSPPIRKGREDRGTTLIGPSHTKMTPLMQGNGLSRTSLHRCHETRNTLQEGTPERTSPPAGRRALPVDDAHSLVRRFRRLLLSFIVFRLYNCLLRIII